jgi:hypothetical protein
LAFQLTWPRISASRGPVSYQVKQFNHGDLSSRAGRAAQAAQQFGAASLSIVGAPQTATLTAANTYYECVPPGESVERGCWGTVAGSVRRCERDRAWTCGTPGIPDRCELLGPLGAPLKPAREPFTS